MTSEVRKTCAQRRGRQPRGRPCLELALPRALTYQDDATRGHFHVWILPLYPEMKELGHGPERILPFLQQTKQTWDTEQHRQRIDRIASALRQALAGVTSDHE